MIAKATRGPGGALLPLVTASLLALPGVLHAVPRFVMEIRDHDGAIAIAGESDAPGHEGALEVVSFGKAYRASSGFPALDTTGLECGIVADKALPKLLEAACAPGSSLAQVDIFYLGDDSLPVPPKSAHMRLEHVQVNGVHVIVGDPNPLGFSHEAVAMLNINFSKVTWIYRAQNPDGTIAGETVSTHVAFEATGDPHFDDDNDGLANDLDSDDDNDGVPDSYETANGTRPFEDDAAGDLDRDTKSNGYEWLTGTRANDSTSFFKIGALSIEDGPDGRTVTVSFPVTGGRHYRLLGTPNPAFPRESWIEFDAFDTAPGSPGTQADIVLNPAVLPQLGRMIFGVEVSLATP